MKEKRLPIRKCTSCMEHFPKNALLRIVKTKEGVITLDKDGKANGRGAYLCKNPACLTKALKRGALERALGCSIPEDVRISLSEAVNEG